jgi:hypothetical protein
MWFISGFEWFNTIGIITYVIPCCICILMFSLRIRGKYKRDIIAIQSEYYVPSLTVGIIIVYLIFTFTPVLNFLSLFELFPELLVMIHGKFSKLLNITVVKGNSNEN